MTQVKIKCDRCGEWVDGLLTSAFTAGFYNVAQPLPGVRGGRAWSQFGREGEEYICDHCMWSDPEYIKIYRYDAEAVQWRKETGLDG